MMQLLFRLSFEFFKTGLFAIGGGLATIPFLTEISEKYGWYTIETLSMMIAVSESTPGPMGVNMSTYVGFTTAGPIGAIVATLSLVTPSIIVICIIANYFDKFKDAKIVKMIFAGLKPAVVAFIGAACLSLFVSTLFNTGNTGVQFFQWKNIVLLLGLGLVNYKFPKVHPILFILLGALAGILFQL